MKKLLSIVALALSSLACNALVSPTVKAPTLVVIIPSETAPVPSLSEKVTLISMTFEDAHAEPPFTSKVTLPALQTQGENDPRIRAFNELLYWTAQNEATQFKNDVIAYAYNPPTAAGSTFELEYTLIGQKADYWSFKYNVYFYSDGAAHPGSFSRTINYDLENGRELSLADIFLPNSNYLQVIADYCKTEIISREAAFESFISGAEPLSENYVRWNLSTEGLVITFDEYQVAPYAAGPQVVKVPYSALQSITDPAGPIPLFDQ